MTCAWCGDDHGVDALCARAQRGLTRRSFIFLSSAAIVGAMMPAPATELVQMVYHPPHGNRHLIGQIVAEEWNRIIAGRLADNIFNVDASIYVPMKDALTTRLREKP